MTAFLAALVTRVHIDSTLVVGSSAADGTRLLDSISRALGEHVVRRNRTMGRDSLKLSTGATVGCASLNGYSLRGWSPDLIVVSALAAEDVRLDDAIGPVRALGAEVIFEAPPNIYPETETP